MLTKDGEPMPEVELFEAQNYRLKEGSIESVVSAKKMMRYEKFDVLHTVDAKHRTNEGLSGVLNSDEAVYQDGIVHFKTNSHYVRSDGVALDGEDVYYDTKQEILSSEKPFIFRQQQSKTHGLSFVYQMKEGTINASNIHSFIQVEEKNR